MIIQIKKLIDDRDVGNLRLALENAKLLNISEDEEVIKEARSKFPQFLEEENVQRNFLKINSISKLNQQIEKLDNDMKVRLKNFIEITTIKVKKIEEIEKIEGILI
jgi:hypothetical protein